MKPLQNNRFRKISFGYRQARRSLITALGVVMCSGFLGVVSAQPAWASSVSDNAYSDTVVDSTQGDVLTADGHVINSDQAAEQKSEAIQTNDISGWPQGPAITAKSAMLMDAGTGTVLYAKNIHDRMYPASTTKMLTCLIAAEKLDLNDSITFSESAIAAVPADGSNIGMSVGETITVEEALYGLMVGSANECANALAEKAAGSIEAFVELMNERAAELGCTDSHFVNTNGLYDDDHYTSAHDLCLIGKAFFDNDVCRKVGNCASYHFQATDTQPDDFTLTNKHELITGGISYTGIIGGKTGYTSQAHENLVTGCERGDMELICVVMREDDPAQFEDTVTLFDYGYESFQSVSVESSALPTADAADFLTRGTDLLGTSTPALTVAAGGNVILPMDASAENLTAQYGSDNTITYYYGGTENGVVVGTTTLVPESLSGNEESSSIAAEMTENYSEQMSHSSILHRLFSNYVTIGLNDTVYINVSAFLLTIIVISVIASFCIRFSEAMKGARERARQRRRRARRAHSQRNEYYERHRYDRDDEYYDNRYDNPYDDWNQY